MIRSRTRAEKAAKTRQRSKRNETVLAIPRPSQQKRDVPAVRSYRDGREICQGTPEGAAEYRRRTLEMAERQAWLCGCGCGILMHYPVPGVVRFDSVTFDHLDLRGMGGGRRDDRIVKDPTGDPKDPENWLNRAVRWECNVARGSKR